MNVNKMSSKVEISPHDREFGYKFSFSYAPAMVVNKEKSVPKEVKGSLMGMTVMNVFGYIPLVSIISGIARIIFALTNKLFDPKGNNSQKGEMKALQQAQIVRGAIECLSIGGLALLISDIVLTAQFLKEMNK